MRVITLGSSLCAAFVFFSSPSSDAKTVHHYVFYGQDRDRMRADSAFLGMRAFEGAQIAYTWRRLEPEKDKYDFSAIRSDLAFLRAHGKRLFVQLQDVSFSESRTPVPDYLLRDPEYNGGAEKQYEWSGDDEEHAVVTGWAARRWDPAVQQRLYKLLDTLGKELDGRIEGINFAESSVGFHRRPPLAPRGFSPEIYRDALIANLKALKHAFPRSVAMQYANFMPGEWRPSEDKGYLRAVYEAAKQSNVGVGGPDLLPFRPGQLGSSYPLIREAAATVPAGIAVQDGNYSDVDRKTGRRMTVAELERFATEYLGVDYIFWCTEEPYYSRELVPYLRRSGSDANKDADGHALAGLTFQFSMEMR
jgi:hypothetical protein